MKVKACKKCVMKGCGEQGSWYCVQDVQYLPLLSSVDIG